MRRILLLAVGALALALAVPGAASAHGRHHHRHHHHAKAHHARTEHFGASANTNPSDPGTPGDAGRVASFTGGVLTMTLADGSTVSGRVTQDTEINCIPAVQTPAPTAGTARDGGSGDQGDDQGDQNGGDQNGGDQNGGDHQGRCHGQSACTVADLVPGAVVHEAILKIGANGAEFKLVLLVKQQQAAS